jgi:4-hydroxy-tetrahydrodipicolinate reductase
VSIKVGVIGAAGRMGGEVCRAVDADGELDLVARVERGDTLDLLVEANADVAVDFTTPSSVVDNVRFCLEHGIHAVVGTTGLTEQDLNEVAGWTERGNANAFVAPNFALGAVMMMMFAAQAAEYFDWAEIVERHHEGKRDAPSGTSLRTAAMMSAARGRPWSARDEEPGASRGHDSSGVRVHSLRLPGSVAHQEVVLGSGGETLTIRHDSVDRTSFMPGVLLAIKQVAGTRGLTIGLEQLLEPPGTRRE